MVSEVSINSNYLKWFHQIEKGLWSFFGLFGDLCTRCALRTLDDVAGGKREGTSEWCCCMIDNQVHDNWDSLNAVQNRFNRRWYDSIRRSKDVRTLRNGPCPALSEHGCRLKKCRPITCTTQLCRQMLVVLNDCKVIRTSPRAALQIEDLIALPDILPELYGIRNGRKVHQADVDAYLLAIRALKDKFAQAIK